MGRIRTHTTISRDPLTMIPGGPHMPWPPEEGYAADARDALAAAQAEASRLGHNHVSPPHIFVGVAVTQTSGVAADVLRDLGISAASARAAIEARMKSSGDPFPIEDVTLTPLGQNVIQRARHEAMRMHHPEARAEHVLIASVHWKDSFVEPVLESLGTTPEALTAAVIAKLDLPPSYGVAENANATDGPYESFDGDAKTMLTFAVREAAGQYGMNSHQFLLGLAALAESGESPAATRILGALGTSANAIRAEFAKFPSAGRAVERKTLSLSAAAKLVIEHAIHLADGGTVRLEHLLVAMDTGDTMASYLFRQLGVSSERLRALHGPSAGNSASSR
jgi:ATP-dependent Clp protease ATP-binding subunit ClpA